MIWITLLLAIRKVKTQLQYQKLTDLPQVVEAASTLKRIVTNENYWALANAIKSGQTDKFTAEQQLLWQLANSEQMHTAVVESQIQMGGFGDARLESLNTKLENRDKKLSSTDLMKELAIFNLDAVKYLLLGSVGMATSPLNLLFLSPKYMIKQAFHGLIRTAYGSLKLAVGIPALSIVTAYTLLKHIIYKPIYKTIKAGVKFIQNKADASKKRSSDPNTLKDAVDKAKTAVKGTEAASLDTEFQFGQSEMGDEGTMERPELPFEIPHGKGAGSDGKVEYRKPMIE
eukprot:NODE_47_length_32105_cov_1.240892.p12 type:complete len:286 gc:universal NODE_47_length_32105_cov_1.240892:28600-27743(-)